MRCCNINIKKLKQSQKTSQTMQSFCGNKYNIWYLFYYISQLNNWLFWRNKQILFKKQMLLKLCLATLASSYVLISSFTTFLSWLFGYAENSLFRKLRSISKIITSQIGLQITLIDILPNILRRKRYQAMKFGQLIAHNMKNIFLGKSYTKCGGGASPRHFYKKSKLSLSVWNNSLKR